LFGVAGACLNFFFPFCSKGGLCGGGGGGKRALNIKCVFRISLKLLSEIFFILRRTKRDIMKNVYRSSCKAPVITLRF